LEYAQSAADAATKAGDAFALQTALLQMLSAQMRKGDVEKSIAIEQRLATIRTDELASWYLTLFRSVRLAWECRFAEAHRLVASCWGHMPFDFDRILSGSEYALFLAIDAQQDSSVRVTREILQQLRSCEVSGLFRVRSLAVARALCALAEAINGRVTYADRALNSLKTNGDPVIAQTVNTVGNIIARLRVPGEPGADRIVEGTEALVGLGYADLARLLGAVDRVLSHGHAASVRRADLTPSEVDVLKLLAEGFVPKDIAARTGRSVYTVRVHIANVISKLGCHGRAEAIQHAHQRGLI
jgi:DNA-binding NarL/FixJ family response regulator